MVDLLLASGADVNAMNAFREMPLHLAARDGRKDVITLLLAEGADLNAKGGEGGFTPLETAVNHGREDTAEVLRQHGVAE